MGMFFYRWQPITEHLKIANGHLADVVGGNRQLIHRPVSVDVFLCQVRERGPHLRYERDRRASILDVYLYEQPAKLCAAVSNSGQYRLQRDHKVTPLYYPSSRGNLQLVAA